MVTKIDRSRLRTVHLVPLTAMDRRGQLDLDIQAEHTRNMYQSGIRVFLPAAGTSEFHSLSRSEITEIVRVTRSASGSDALIFAPVGLQVEHAIGVGQDCLEAGADGIMFMPFSHPYLSDTGCLSYFREIGRAHV